MRMVLLGAIVVAAGKGTRMGTKESKQYLKVGGKPILVHTLEKFQRADIVGEIVLVVGADDVALCEGYREQYGLDKIKAIVTGGGERQFSVHAGLLRSKAEWVLVHDGVRPFVASDLMARCWEAAERFGGAVAAVPVKDTIKEADSDGRVAATPDRSRLWAVQTPQAFRRESLIQAHETAFRDGFVGTDDASIAERVGIPVHIVHGDYGNIKITTPDDLEWAEFRLSKEAGKEGALN